MNHLKHRFDGTTTRKVLYYTALLNVFIVLLVFSIGNSTKTVFAQETKLPFIDDAHLGDLEETTGDKDDLQHAVESAPDGLPLKDYFQLGEFPSGQILNTAKVISHKNNVYDGSSLLLVNNSIRQLGAIWGNPDQDNYFDPTLFQTMSMWVYLGHSKSNFEQGDNSVGDIPTHVGDGMALVFQNDPRGVGAISTYKEDKGDEKIRLGTGEAMGVWGPNFNNKLYENGESFSTNDGITLKKKIASMAIQKSLALEFDTYPDNSANFIDLNNLGISFDMGKQGQHISLGYPANPEIYEPHLSGYDSNRSRKLYYRMVHNRNTTVDNQYLANGNWHHITIKWNPNTKRLYCFFDDRDKNKNIQHAQVTISSAIDLSVFDLKNSHKLRWGFTGSTGEFSENNLIVFESIPSFVNAELNMQIFDRSTGTIVGENLENSEGNSTFYPSANAGDTLDFTYDLNYQSGIKNWDKIVANINLSSEVEYLSSYVDYNDGDPVEEVKTNPMSGNKFTYHIGKSLTPSHNKATLHIITRVKPVSKTNFVSGQLARFEGDYLIKDGMSPQFRIASNALNMRVDPEQIDYQEMSQVPDDSLINCYVWNNKPNNDLSGVSLSVSVNGTSLPKQKLIKETSYYVPTKIAIPKSQLQEGTNTVVIKTEETDGRQTFTCTKTVFINVGGNVRISYRTHDVSFATINGTSGNKLVPRSGIWKVDVTDTRKRGSDWRVSAQASPLTNTKTGLRFNGKMVFVDKNNNRHLLNDQVEVGHAIKATDKSETWNLVDQWSNNQGIQLQTDNSVEEGDYQGQISWILVNSL
ncbi:L-type lectin family protein [Companilactobacillus zhongbaensis]|uniref:lectin-like domain-containing protein n=1 Tax=Companilactobacillus zhongbaensis TaxID=2486009 RepID=UPI000F78689D|nr:hypothetical protein [Companilactobacillus zhongbaensis]